MQNGETDMPDKIILFKGYINSLRVFTDALSRGFNELGCETVVIDTQSPDSLKEFTAVIDSPFLCSIGYNNTTASITYDTNKYACDLLNVKYNFNYLVDHPFHYHTQLLNPPKNSYILTIDRNHKNYIKSYYSTIENVEFIPHFGIPCKNVKPFKEREIDVLFGGNYVPASLDRSQFDYLGEAFTPMLNEIADDLIANTNKTLEQSFNDYLIKNNLPVSKNDFADIMSQMTWHDIFIRNYVRDNFIKAIVDSGIKVNVFGEGWENLECKNPQNLIIGGKIDLEKNLELLGNAKISLNIMPWFKDGSHERIFNSVINGALCITDPSKYIQEIFTNRESIILYSLDRLNELPDIIKELLENQAEAEKIANNGYVLGKAKHSYKECANHILELCV